MFKKTIFACIFAAAFGAGCDNSGGDEFDPLTLLAATGNVDLSTPGGGGDGSGDGSSGSGSSGGTTPTCRNIATNVDITNPAVNMTAAFNSGTNQLSVTVAGTTTVFSYASRADFIREGTWRFKFTTLTAVNPGNTTTYTYDGQSRLTGYSFSSSSDSYAFTAWDSGGSYTTGTMNFTNCSNRNISRSFDDANFTITEVQSGGTGGGCGVTRTIVTSYDSDLLIQQIQITTSSTTTRTYTTNSMTAVCL